jgi:general nucleoside transport system ATP-binding protein
MSSPLAELRDIVKVFPGVRANDGITFSIEGGEVHGLLGENGAGKSTLMSILYGLYQPDEGTILRAGVPVRLPSPRAALEAGIAIVQQHFALVPTMTVAQNVVLGAEPSWRLSNRSIESKIREITEQYHLDIDPRVKVGTLSVGERQRVEILKCLYRSPEIVIFDEPTTVLIPQEIHDLFVTLRALAAEGKGIVLITHKLDELLQVTDRITVLRAGRSAGTVNTADVDGQTLARLMVGRDVRLRSTASFVGLDADDAPTNTRSIDRTTTPVLSLKSISLTDGGVERLRNITLDVAPGEIVGVAGVEGNGQRELVELLCGTRLPSQGTITVRGADVTTVGPTAMGAAGVRVVTEDRHHNGCVLDMTVGENLVCDRIRERPYSRNGILSWSAINSFANDLIQDFRVKTPGPNTLIRSLSGGNQQRAILARELSRPVTVLVAAQPTRGLDVGAIEEITERVTATRDSGAGVLLVSSDLSEIMALSDRIAVLYRGAIVGIVDRRNATTEHLGELMAGLVTGENSTQGYAEVRS